MNFAKRSPSGLATSISMRSAAELNGSHSGALKDVPGDNENRATLVFEATHGKAPRGNWGLCRTHA
jgi:hypothetical protein